jgi:hypothetical protein
VSGWPAMAKINPKRTIIWFPPNKMKFLQKNVQNITVCMNCPKLAGGRKSNFMEILLWIVGKNHLKIVNAWILFSQSLTSSSVRM